MTFLHSEMRYLLSTYLPNFDLACKAIEPCPDDLAVCHVTVVRLSANGFGRLFRYCPVNRSGHELEAQESDLRYNEIRYYRAISAIPPVEMQHCGNRHLLLGGVAEWNRTLEVRMELRLEKIKVALEVLWYIRGRESPISVPLMGWVRNGTVYAPISQPITQEMFKNVNPWYVAPVIAPFPGYRPQPEVVEVWSSFYKTWTLPAEPGILQIPLPFTEVPILRFSSVQQFCPSPEDASKGYMLEPLSSMKAQIYDLPYIWPQCLTFPRSRLDAAWRLFLSGPEPVIKSWGFRLPGPGEDVREDGSQNHLALALPNL